MKPALEVAVVLGLVGEGGPKGSWLLIAQGRDSRISVLMGRRQSEVNEDQGKGGP